MIINSQTHEKYRIDQLAQYSHDRSMFTQGLSIRDDIVYESGGIYGHSRVLAYPFWQPEQILREFKLPSEQFAEGLTVTNDRDLWLLTWREQVVYQLDLDSFAIKRQFRAADHPDLKEGWGICSDQTVLYTSDGSATIAIRDIHSFQLRDQIQVFDVESGLPVSQLNELEYYQDRILANIYGKQVLAVIHPQTGSCFLIPFEQEQSLMQESDIGYGKDFVVTRSHKVMNGIAACTAGEIIVTGKCWPHAYRLSLELRDR